MIERSRSHQCDDQAAFSQGVARIVDEAVGSHLQLCTCLPPVDV